jgi:hypothetical protein
MQRTAPEKDLVLTASEIGTYAFCPQAWYLQRRHVLRSVAAEHRLAQGSATHERIGRRTDDVRLVERVQWLVLLFGLLLATGIVVLLVAWGQGHS